jgi:hypothetical protein
LVFYKFNIKVSVSKGFCLVAYLSAGQEFRIGNYYNFCLRVVEHEFALRVGTPQLNQCCVCLPVYQEAAYQTPCLPVLCVLSCIPGGSISDTLFTNAVCVFLYASGQHIRHLVYQCCVCLPVCQWAAYQTPCLPMLCVSSCMPVGSISDTLFTSAAVCPSH